MVSAGGFYIVPGDLYRLWGLWAYGVVGWGVGEAFGSVGVRGSERRVLELRAWRASGLSKSFISRVIIGVTPFRVLITLLITYLLSPLPLQEGMEVSGSTVLGLLAYSGFGAPTAKSLEDNSQTGKYSTRIRLG